jgi:ComF family protein
MLKRLLQKTFHHQHYCYLCNLKNDSTEIICSLCQSFFTPNTKNCQQCAHPLPLMAKKSCGLCLTNPPYFDSTQAPYLYEDPLKYLLLNFKFNHHLFLSKFLSQLIIKNLKFNTRKMPDYLLPVPLYKKRIRERGFNQAIEITRTISQILNIPYDSTTCSRVKYTSPQSSLKAAHRKKNMKNAFKVKSTEYAHVAIIDDIMTTGATVNELARVLKSQGVKIVDVWCCARTNNHNL